MITLLVLTVMACKNEVKLDKYVAMKTTGQEEIQIKKSKRIYISSP